MEGRKKVVSSSSSSSSFTELFGPTESHPSSGFGIFESMFSPSPKVFGRVSRRSEVNGKTGGEGSSTKIGTPPDFVSKGSDGENQSTANKDMNSTYQEHRVQPCHLSSSIYYGGQDIYSHPQNAANKDLNSIYQEQRVQPCHLSSSFYYGGQDIYSHPQSARDTGLNSLYKNDGGEDDSGSASRGNWWKGSLYY